jgi:hypothetical protein
MIDEDPSQGGEIMIHGGEADFLNAASIKGTLFT